MKVFYSVELKADMYDRDDFCCGTYEECIQYLISHDYKTAEARIAKFEINDGKEDIKLLSEQECFTRTPDDGEDPECVDIIEDWADTWSDNFRQLRSRYSKTPNKLTRDDVYCITGIPVKTLQKWETGDRKPSDYMLELLACKLREW